MILKNGKIVLLDKIIQCGYIVIENGKIEDIQEGQCNLSKEEVIDLKGNIVMPGFIDIHTHGCLGIDFMNATPKQIEQMAKQYAKEGITTFLATTLTSPADDLKKVAINIKDAMNFVPTLGGIHLEGPFISKKYKGAQNEKYIRKATIDELNNLIQLSNNNVRLITLAPENEGTKEVVPFLLENNITVSMGHSDATFKEASEIIQLGATNLTHAHNAMSGYHHRKPGLLEAGMYHEQIYCEIICDRVHVCDETLKTFYKIIGPKRFMIITDSLSGKASTNKEFKMMNMPVIKKDGAAYLKDGTLAGSILCFDQGVRNINDLVKPSLCELARISSYNQSRSLHLLDRGEIKIGNLADLVILDEKLNLLTTYKLGKKI